ncbi:hypothetical protein PM082_024134 [Marasmius tenuissimus]|nr:hypothetical protein PM082_024134 [Marasmius tenuissimus]
MYVLCKERMLRVDSTHCCADIVSCRDAAPGGYYPEEGIELQVYCAPFFLGERLRWTFEIWTRNHTCRIMVGLGRAGIGQQSLCSVPPDPSKPVGRVQETGPKVTGRHARFRQSYSEGMSPISARLRALVIWKGYRATV